MHVKLFRFRRVMQEVAVFNLDSDLDTNHCGVMVILIANFDSLNCKLHLFVSNRASNILTHYFIIIINA